MRLKSKLVFCGLLTVVPIAAHSLMVANGGFSTGNVNFTTSYAYYAGSGNGTFGGPPPTNMQTGGLDLWDEGVYTITNVQPKLWHNNWREDLDLTGHGYYMLLNGTANAQPSTAWSQTIVPSLAQGTKYRLSFDVATVFRFDPYEAQLNISIGNHHLGYVLAPLGTEQWRNVSLDFVYDNSWGSVANLLNLQMAAYGNDFAIDNISVDKVQAVPEPATLAFAALGVGAFLRKRLRK